MIRASASSSATPASSSRASVPAIPPGELGDHAYYAYLEVASVDAFYAEVTARGAEVVKPIRDEPWGMREFGIRTADGHRMMFGAPVEAS